MKQVYFCNVCEAIKWENALEKTMALWLEPCGMQYTAEGMAWAKQKLTGVLMSPGTQIAEVILNDQ